MGVRRQEGRRKRFTLQGNGSVAPAQFRRFPLELPVFPVGQVQDPDGIRPVAPGDGAPPRDDNGIGDGEVEKMQARDFVDFYCPV